MTEGDYTDEVDHGKVWWQRDQHGPTHAKVQAAIGAGSSGIDGVSEELALMAADLVDAAKINQDPRLWLAASQRLMGLMDRKPKNPGGIQGELFSTIEGEPE